MKFPNVVNALMLLIACGCLLFSTTFAQGRGPGGRGPGGPPPPPPEGGRMALHFLDLTEAQKAQIETIQETEDAKEQAFHDKLRDAHDALEAATAQGQFNEAQVRTLAAAIAQNEVELTVIRTRKDAAIYQVLTPEQRAKLDQLHAERLAHRPPPPPRAPRNQ
jgi:Spy/CpxP family protein refolding chaperone